MCHWTGMAGFLGWIMADAPNHWIGAAIAIAGIFLPGLLLVLAALRYWQPFVRIHRWPPCLLA